MEFLEWPLRSMCVYTIYIFFTNIISPKKYRRIVRRCMLVERK